MSDYTDNLRLASSQICYPFSVFLSFSAFLMISPSLSEFLCLPFNLSISLSFSLSLILSSFLICLSFSVSLLYISGTCQCHGTIPLAQICDASCRASAPTMSCSNSTTGTGDILVKENGVVRTIAATSFTSAGSLSCAPVSGGSSAIYSMSTLSGAFMI